MTRRLLRILAFMLVAAVALIVTAAVTVQTAWFKDRLRQFAVRWSAQYLNGQLSIGRLSGSLFDGVTLQDVAIVQDGRDVFRAADVTIRYDPFVLARRRVAFADITLTGAAIQAIQDREGWTVGRLLRPLSKTGPPVDFAIGRIRLVDSNVTIEPRSAPARHLSNVGIDAGLTRRGGRLTVTLAHAQALDDRSGYRVTQLSGSFRDALEALDLQFAAESGTEGVAGRVVSDAAAVGRRFAVAADVRSFDAARVVEDSRWTTSVTGHATAVIDLPPAPVPVAIAFTFKGPSASGFGYEGRDLDVAGRWTNDRLMFDAQGSGYGARARINAVWEASRFSGSGTFHHVNMARVPRQLAMPAFASDLAGRFRVGWQQAGWSADVSLARSEIAGATLAAGTVGHVDGRASGIHYVARGELARLNVRRISGPLALPILAASRFESELSGAFHADGVWSKGGRRSLQAGASLRSSTIGGMRVDPFEVTAALEDQRLQIDASGTFERLTSLTAGLPETYALEANGTANLTVVFADLSVPLTLDAVDVTGRVDLAPSAVQGIAIHRAVVDGSLVKGLATVTELDVESDDARATATGTMALGSEGESSLTLKVAADDLRAIGQRLGRPISGAADLEATVSGPADHPRATGTLNARQLAYGETAEALTVEVSFDAEAPNRNLAQVDVKGETSGTFLKVGSVELVRWAGKMEYRDRQLDLEAHFEEQVRQLNLAGLVGLEAGSRNIAIRQLQVTSGETVWAAPEGQQARVALDADRVRVEGLTLSRASQQIAIDGSLALTAGAADTGDPDVLRVDVTAVQVADINQLLLGARKLSGVADGTATLTGSLKAPVVDGRLAITNGSVEDVHFDAARGSFHYADDRATIEATLDQSAASHLSIAGTVPVKAAASGDPGMPIDLTVKSTAVDLGLAQALTSELNSISGTGMFDLHVTGTRQSPNVNGSVTLRAGAFDVAATGVRYQDVMADLAFKDRHLEIASMRLTDSHGHPIQIEGGLDVLGDSADRALDVRLQAIDVNVLDNKSGFVQIDSDLQVTGDLRSPKVSGTVRVEQGRIEIDRVLEAFTKNVYSTRPQVEEPEAGASDVADVASRSRTPATSSGVFDRLDLSVDLRVPDNLVLRGRDLRVGGTSMGLGDTNIVAGGTLAIRKAPGADLGIQGTLEIVRGYYAFQGRRFEVQRDSTVRFRGGSSLDPAIDVTATRLTSGVDAAVRVQGSARRPTMTLSSNPPLDDADILALIVFGQPANDLGMSERVSLAERAGTIAAGAIATPLADSVARALNLDLFELQAPAGDSKAPAVSVGTQIGTRLYVGVRQEIGYEESSAVSLEYRFARFMRLVSKTIGHGSQHMNTLGNPEAGGVDLFFVFRY